MLTSKVTEVGGLTASPKTYPVTELLAPTGSGKAHQEADEAEKDGPEDAS